jgi:IclR family mhp operon transcriptional activator
MLLDDETIQTAPKERREAPPRCRANSVRGSTEQANASYDPIKAVQRALSVLRALNDLRCASVGDIHRRTGISKPTIVRMLETLINEGYVARDNFFGGYRVTSQVQALSSGFSGKPILIEAARGWAVDLTRSVKWPISLGTASEGEIFVDFTTSPISPWSYPFAVLHTRLKMLTTAMGRCYLAFCPDDEREALLESYRAKTAMPGLSAEIGRASRAVDQIRANGYAHPDPQHASRRFEFIAVPIMDEDRCIAAMGMGFYRRAVPFGDVRERLYAPMREAATGIEHDIRNVRACMSAGVPLHSC